LDRTQGAGHALTDVNGNVSATYKYEPFGKLIGSPGTVTNAYRWLGGGGVYWDGDVRLYKMGTRYYDAELGRFTQVDPVAGGSATAYDYAEQDPINKSDRDGQKPTCEDFGWNASVIACAPYPALKAIASLCERGNQTACRVMSRGRPHHWSWKRCVNAVSRSIFLAPYIHGAKHWWNLMRRRSWATFNPRSFGASLVITCVGNAWSR
jgi:RHS repeat-associated protein